MTGDDTEKITKVRTPAGDPAWLVTDYHAVRELIADPRIGWSPPEAGAARYSASMMVGDGEARSAPSVDMRAVFSRALSPRRVEELRPRVEEILEELLDDMVRAGPPLDLHENLSFPFPARVVCALLGVPVDDMPVFRRWADDAAHLTDAGRAREGRANLEAYMGELIAAKAVSQGEDLLSEIARAAADDETVARSAVPLATGLLFAGHETTMDAIDRGVVLLLTHQDQLRAITREPTLVPGAVEETLRYPLDLARDSVTNRTGLPHYAREDISFHGEEIRRGDLVLFGLLQANDQADVFPAPRRFDVRRVANEHLTFGHGRRYCRGAGLARLELYLVFERLFARLPRLSLAVPSDELLRRKDLMTTRFDAVPVTW